MCFCWIYRPQHGVENRVSVCLWDSPERPVSGGVEWCGAAVFVLSQRWRGICFLANWQTEMDEGQAEPHHVAREGLGVEKKRGRVEGEGISLIWRWTAECGWENERMNATGTIVSSICIQLFINFWSFIKKWNIPVVCALGPDISWILKKISVCVLSWCVTQTDTLVCLESGLECFKQPLSVNPQVWLISCLPDFWPLPSRCLLPLHAHTLTLNSPGP